MHKQWEIYPQASLRGAKRRSNPCFRLRRYGLLRFARNDEETHGSGDHVKMKVIGLAGWSGAGKTTLLTRVIPHLRHDGLSVSVIKHAHHKFDVDIPGKD